MFRVASVLISDEIDPECVEILKAADISVTVKTGMSKEALIQEIVDFDAIIVRSATNVTAEVIEAGKNLKLIGRAGTGVDNIDLNAANAKGVVVMNTPAGNSLSAAELTCAMLMSLARKVPQAHSSMKQGKWARKEYMGTELNGKTLAIIGLGRIGKEVALRMQSFRMRTIAFDPCVTVEMAKKENIDMMPLDAIWPIADYITVHVPLIKKTENLINEQTLSKCKNGVCIVNVARGGIVNENDIINAIKSKKCAGAAFDVFTEEPPKNRELIDLPEVIATPHLGASTKEAQKRVAREIADNIVALNSGKGLFGALNGSTLSAVLDESSAQMVDCGNKLAQIVEVLAKKMRQKPDQIVVEIPKSWARLENAIRAGAIVGLLKLVSTNGLNLVNAEMNAKNAGLTICTKLSNLSLIRISAGSVSVSGYATPAGPILTEFNGKKMPLPFFINGNIALTEASIEVPSALKAKVLTETGLKSGGRAVCLDEVTESERMELDVNHWTLIRI